MSNKPVAWVELEAWESGKYPPDDCFAEHPFENAIPLYTSPQEPNCYGDGNVYRGVRSKDSEVQTIHIGGVRELTDEEILPIYMEYSSYYDDQRLYVDIYGFARAILRKASEK